MRIEPNKQPRKIASLIIENPDFFVFVNTYIKIVTNNVWNNKIEYIFIAKLLVSYCGWACQGKGEKNIEF